MGSIDTSNLKIGFIAGGQLAKMLIQKASQWDLETYILDPDNRCASQGLTNHFMQGDFKDENTVYNFGKQVDILTFEIESINVNGLKRLVKEGVKVIPHPDILEMIQDKGLQKTFFEKHHFPTAAFRYFDDKSDIIKSINEGSLTFPFVQKARKGGYDGRGVSIIHSQNDLENILDTPSVVEEAVSIAKEISVIVARNKQGEIQSFPIVEMIFDPKANLVKELACPAKISIEQEKKARDIAHQLIEKMDMVGLLAIEFFIDTKGDIFINEMAPRPHNSGHHTIESNITSQYEQLLRAVLDMPLGSTKMLSPAVMINLLGDPNHEGAVHYENLEKVMAIEGAHVHLYGKKITRPFRKMGHVTITDNNLENALAKAEKIHQLLKVTSWKTDR
jgi:5-(carboxyamino)imidazole ribonucleotide synthase